MISQKLSNRAMRNFVEVFKVFPVFQPFLCLLPLKLGHDVDFYELWTLKIDELFSPAQCQLVNEAYMVSRSVTFEGSLDAIQTLKSCSIGQAQKVTLVLTDVFDLSGSLEELRHLPISHLFLRSIETGKISTAEFVDVLSRNPHLKTITLCLDSSDPKHVFFSLISSLKNITRFCYIGDVDRGLWPEDCEFLGRSLIFSNVTTLEMGSESWDVFLSVSYFLYRTKVERLKITKCDCFDNLVPLNYADAESEEYSSDEDINRPMEKGCFENPAQQFFENIAKSNVKHLAIIHSKLLNPFALLLSAATGLKLTSLDLHRNSFTKEGAAALVQMDMPSLRSLDLRNNSLDEGERRATLLLNRPLLHLRV